jgi:hypothetical protein
MSLPCVVLSYDRFATSLTGSMHVPCIRRSGGWAYCGMDALRDQAPDFTEREWMSGTPVIWRICLDCISAYEKEHGETPAAWELQGKENSDERFQSG